MLYLSDLKYAIVDIETAGGAPVHGGITEIAVVIHDGEKIVESFETLINPETGIPAYITGLTGIDNAMVRQSPLFSEIADQLFDLLEGKIFVAHQVNFDLSFIRESFKKVGIDFKPNKLCTVRLSRKAFPGLSSYSLGRICERFDIPILARHRAMGDAKATAILFDKILKDSPEIIDLSLKKNSGETFLPPNFSKERYDQIPQECGVYYMLNAKSKVVYVGKAINIKERFKSHFSGNSLPKLKAQLKAEVVDLKWEITGTEFMALLKEVLEIKRLWPTYNSALKLPKKLWGLFVFEDGNGFKRFQMAKVNKGLFPLETFFSRDEAMIFLKTAIEKYALCEKLCGIRKLVCELDKSFCEGACHGEEKPESYNSRIDEFIQRIKETQLELEIRLPGRVETEEAVCIFDRGILTKYGFVEKNQKVSEKEGSLELAPSFPETFYILKQYIHTFSPDQIRVLAV